MSSVRADGPVFVVGVGRSGTSLLQTMLASHPRLAFPPETAFLRRYVVPGLLGRAFASGGADAVVALLAEDPHVGALDLDLAALVPGVAPGERYDARVYAALIAAWADARGAARWGDKDPRLVEILPTVKALFPDARVVHIIRDPRDVLASKKKAEWSRRWPVPWHVLANRTQLILGRRHGRRAFGDAYVEVRYESLLADPQTELTRICATLGEDFDPAMLDFSEEAARIMKPYERAWKAETLGPLLADNAGRWAERLEPWEVALTEATCTEALAVGGYPLSGPALQPGPLGRLRADAWASAVRAASVGYAWWAETRQRRRGIPVTSSLRTRM